MVLPVLFGLATAGFGAMSAIGKHQQAKAQTRASNQAAANRYRDALMMRQYQYGKEVELYNQRVKDYQAGIKESELALGRAFTALDKRAAERLGQAAFARQESLIKDIQTQGQLSNLQAGGSADRLRAMAVGAAGRREALVADNLLRARYGDIDRSRDLEMQANVYRRKLFSALPMTPTMAPVPAAPVMQSGPSALSLIGGLGSAALGGITAGMSMSSMMPSSGGMPGASNFSAASQGVTNQTATAFSPGLKLY
jgi:hypothetical protein